MMVEPPIRELLAAPVATRKLRVAAVVTEFTYRSHAHVILENFLEPYLFNGKKTDPGMEVVSLYVDQFPRGDMARDVAAEYGITIYPTIAEALRAGGDRLAVDAVLSIGEHGKYPTNAKGQWSIRASDSSTRSWPSSAGAVDGAGVQRQAPVVPGRLGERDGRDGPGDGLPAHGGQLGPAGERRPRWSCRRARGSGGGLAARRGPGGLRLPRAGGVAVDGRGAGRGRDGDQGSRVLRWRPPVEGGRRGPMVARAGRPRPGNRPRPRTARPAARARPVGRLQRKSTASW